MRLLSAIATCSVIACGPGSAPSTKSVADSAADTGTLAAPLTTSGVITCADPDARQRLGPLESADLGPGWTAQTPAGWDSAPLEPSGGVAVADFTGDGLLDYFLPADSPCMLFVAQPDGTLVDESAARIPGGADECRAWGASAADFDNDGDLDLFVPREREPDQLWENDGTGHFADITDAAGIPAHLCGSRSGSWGDMDGDGDLDLFVSAHRVVEEDVDGPCVVPISPLTWRMDAGGPNLLLENRGDGTFADRTAELHFDLVHAYSFVAGWYDLDQDADLDLFVINDYSPYSTPTTAWINQGGGQFTELDPLAGLQLQIFGMSLSPGDLNNDGIIDFAVSDIERLHLMESLGPSEWVDRAIARGVVPDLSRQQAASWGTALEDIDNDGLLDLVAVFGPTEDALGGGGAALLEQPDGLFVQQADGSFEDVAPAWGFDATEVGRGLVVADLNGDGWLDFVRPNHRSGPTTIHHQRCGDAAWLTVALDGPGMGYGARVEVEAGGHTRVRWMDPTNEALGSTGPAVVHFGLGQVDQIDTLRVLWPDGTTSENHLIEPRQHVVVGHLGGSDR